MFAEINKPVEPFTNSEELLLKLESKEYRAVVYYKLMYHEFVNPLKFKGVSEFYNRLIKAHEHNPSLYIPRIDEAMEEVLRSEENLVLVTLVSDLFYLQSTFCNITTQLETYTSPSWLTMYTRHGLNLKFKPAAKTLFNKEFIRLHNEYFPRKHCENDLEDALDSGPQALSIHQLQSAFWLLGMAALVGFCVTFFECLKKRKSGRKKTVAPQQVNL